MNEQRKQFLNELKYIERETSQEEMVKEAIRKQLFVRLNEMKLKKDETTDLNQMAEYISKKLEISEYQIQIAQYIKQVLQSGNYQFDIDEKGDIRANYSRLFLLQQEQEEKLLKESKEMFREIEQ